jgi:hypothetical protein
MSNIDVFLTPDQKRYTDKYNNFYDRVTSFIHSYTEPFDAETWAKKLSGKPHKRVPEYEFLSPQGILDKWAADNRRSLDEGNYVHAKLEQVFSPDLIVEHRPDLVSDEFIHIYIRKLKELFRGLTPKVYPEYRLYSKELALAGTTDLKIVNHGLTSFLDYKTNKVINFEAKFDKYFLEPLTFVPYCEYYEYTIQMSIYAYMDKLINGSHINKLTLLHCKHGIVKAIPIQYREDLVLKLLIHSGKKSI